MNKTVLKNGILLASILISLSYFAVSITHLVYADSAKWYKENITITILADDDIKQDGIDRVKQILTDDGTRIRSNGNISYSNWNSVTTNNDIPFKLSYTDAQNADIKIRLHSYPYKSTLGTIHLTSDDAQVLGITHNTFLTTDITSSNIDLFLVNKYNDHTFYKVINHEIGHSLGLQHNNCMCIMNISPTIGNITNIDVDYLLRLYRS